MTTIKPKGRRFSSGLNADKYIVIGLSVYDHQPASRPRLPKPIFLNSKTIGQARRRNGIKPTPMTAAVDIGQERASREKL